MAKQKQSRRPKPPQSKAEPTSLTLNPSSTPGFRDLSCFDDYVKKKKADHI